ncbi:hypothetical protein [Roseivirga misakiensis]|uniref:DUF3298 domain-containing protein n=1 Tax=Roseivirga misakiensis TaxID=1563681 RepID=A0A1E5T4Y1_9BACT|nr:hypothetical protein [Roseivirga misakiensis]OEK06421.1 hypothetical protein BFP71_01720 [Roseivirga misakiensis]
MKLLKTLALLFLSSGLLLGQTSNDNLAKADTPVKTHQFKFEKATPTLLKVDVKKVQTLQKANLQTFDLSFLKDYEFKEYNMGEYYFNSTLICMPFIEWGSHVIPFHLKQQTFTVMKKKK